MMKFIEKLPEKRWKEFKDLRLKAVSDSPKAVSTTLEEAEKITKKNWIELLVNNIFIEDDGLLVGMVGGYVEKQEKFRHISNIVAVYVLPEYRGKKLGELLVKKMIEKLVIIDDIKKIKLSVVATQKQAVSLYKKLGFIEIGLEKYAIKIGDDYFDRYLMELYL